MFRLVHRSRQYIILSSSATPVRLARSRRKTLRGQKSPLRKNITQNIRSYHVLVSNSFWNIFKILQSKSYGLIVNITILMTLYTVAYLGFQKGGNPFPYLPFSSPPLSFPSPFLSFPSPTVKFRRGHPQRGRQIEVWYQKFAIFNQYLIVSRKSCEVRTAIVTM